MSNYSDSPAAVSLFKQSTEERHKTMAGVSYYRFFCPECKASKPVKGRVERGWRKGYRCLECEEKRLARSASQK